MSLTRLHSTNLPLRPFFAVSDGNIPETGLQRSKSSVGDEDCCYTHCGSPGRGLCEHCPGRPANDTAAPVDCATDGSGARPPCRSGAALSAAARTLNQVLPTMWTACALTLMIHLDLLQCLLVMCVTGVRTSLTLIKTTWRMCS